MFIGNLKIEFKQLCDIKTGSLFKIVFIHAAWNWENTEILW